MRARGYNEFSLLSLSCSDYLALPAVGVEIKNRLKDENISLSLPSQRVDRFDENIANIIGGTRKSGLTFAPEAGTQRMRDVINKGLTNEELLRGIQTAVKEGWDKVKLYFMIGLPGETDLDVLGIAETIQWLRRECGNLSNRRLNFNITISNFTPKPHTPFQWHSVSTSGFARKQKLLKEAFRQIRGLKVNYTDVRISAMEDFVGRGDRRLSKVVRRAWELGAGMDSWWENLPQAYGAWEQAIAESDLTWKYRKVESGEWNIFETTDQDPLDAPLPWDHINTGIDKQWLKDDLHRALEAATVPDCAFDGCSHCGICGTDFGHNIVQRFRVRFGKKGDMRLVSHLDLVRLFDRAVRRASIPVAYTNGFHPSPRISIANALTLGATSDGEIIDLELREILDVADFRQRLESQFPADIPILAVEEVPLKSRAATALITEAEYLIDISIDEATTSEDWESWIQQIQKTAEILFEKKTKSGKMKQFNLCDRLTSISLEQVMDEHRAQIRYQGSCRNDGTLLQPDHVVFMLEKLSGKTAQLVHAHRVQLIFGSEDLELDIESDTEPQNETEI
jgi:radical SAM-linked protein